MGADAKETLRTHISSEHLTGLQYWLGVSALCLAVFVITLDSTIIATATPYITNEFNSLGDIGWYANIYPTAIAMSQLSYGKLAARYSVRHIYSIAMLLFLVGSTVCAAAPHSTVLIAGRAISGLGASGLLICAFALVPIIALPAKRASLFSLFSVSRGVAVTCGPLIGGALTSRVSWRWNFYINLPLGVVTYLVFLYAVRPSKRPLEGFTSWSDLIDTLDLLGLSALLTSLICLLLALEWGGVKYAWGSGQLIALLVLFIVFLVAFAGIEARQNGKAMLPARVFLQRTVLSASFFTICTTGAIFTITYYLPIWLQAVKQKTPLASGVSTLPWVITSTVTALGSGILLSKIGHTWAFMIVASTLGCIGSGLFTTFKPNTSRVEWIGYQIIYAVGSSIASYTPVVATQNNLPPADIPIGSGMILFCQTIGSALFVSIAQALFTNHLASGLQVLGVQGFNASTVATGSIASLTRGLDAATKAKVLGLINDSLTTSWFMAVILSCLSIVGALGVFNESRMKNNSRQGDTDNEEQKAEELAELPPEQVSEAVPGQE